MKKTVAMMIVAIAAASVFPAYATAEAQNEITEESLGFHREMQDIGVEQVGPNIQRQMLLRGDGSTLLASYTFEKFLGDGYYHEFGSFTGNKIRIGA